MASSSKWPLPKDEAADPKKKKGKNCKQEGYVTIWSPLCTASRAAAASPQGAFIQVPDRSGVGIHLLQGPGAGSWTVDQVLVLVTKRNQDYKSLTQYLLSNQKLIFVKFSN